MDIDDSSQKGEGKMTNTLPNIGKPALQALEIVHITSLEQVAKYAEADLLKLHGLGPKAISILKEALSQKDLSFSAGTNLPYQPNFLVLGDLQCDNAPKRRVIRDLMIAMASCVKKHLKELVNSDIHVTVNGQADLEGLDAFVEYLGNNKINLSSLELTSILSHGKFGAADGIAIDNKGRMTHFATIVTFDNTKKDALVKEMRLYIL